MNDIVINKIQSIQRCIARAREEYNKDPLGFEKNYSIQDASVLNLVRACDTAIDLANHIVRIEKMGIPTSSKESFELLAKKDVISGALAKSLAGMVSFRNTAVHEYKDLDLSVVIEVVICGSNDLLEFTDAVHAKFSERMSLSEND